MNANKAARIEPSDEFAKSRSMDEVFRADVQRDIDPTEGLCCASSQNPGALISANRKTRDRVVI
jgi:hypothetical protein